MTTPLRCFVIMILFTLVAWICPASQVQAAYTLSPNHPRVLITPSDLATIVDRINGSGAREPYTGWYTRILARETQAQTEVGMTPSLMSLALIYHVTQDVEEKETFKSWYLNALDTQLDDLVAQRRNAPDARCGPSYATLISMDLMWAHILDATKLNAFEAASGINAFHYNSGANQAEQNFNYHGAIGRAPAFAFAALFDGESILNHPDVAANPSTYSFNTAIYIEAMVEELSDSGNFWQVENRIAGAPAHNTALPGDFGGMYDNMGYDGSEEAWSIFLVAAFSAATGEDRLSGFLHDQYRGRFYQNMEIPYTANQDGSDQDAYTEHRFEVVWNTQTDWMTSPNTSTVALIASKYKDPHMQYYADRWRKKLNTYSYDYYTTEVWRMLCFYDDSLSITPPSVNPTARYFSGPGLVSMRDSWKDDAAFAVFMAGEGISRRYEDANSFVLSRKGPIVVHAGARIRFNDDNDKHHWYHIRSISKNTMKIFDPLESFDVDPQGRITALHSGTPLVDSDNMGGQLHETGISSQDGLYTTGYSGTLETRGNEAFDLGIWNTADVTAYEHVADTYTYAKGDATDAYTRKIDYFEREFLYLRPDVFVLFDRVRSADPSFTKAWTIHTVDQPKGPVAGSPVAQGAVSFGDNRRLDIDNGTDRTTLYTVLPVSARTIVSGGDTVLTTGHPLQNGVDIEGSAIESIDTPRWLELFAVGADTEGSVTLYGDAEEDSNTSETIVFDGTTQTYQGTTSTYDEGTRVVFFEDHRLRHTGKQWQPNQWAGYMLETRGGSNPLITITGNGADELQLNQSVDGSSSVWAYAIVRPLANTTLHWRKIDRITTTDMDLASLTLSAPHYFDARSADGTNYSFSPHTDGISDGYSKRTYLGQWTVEIEPTTQEHQTYFLNVFSLGDSGTQPVSVSGFNGDTASGAAIGDQLVAFAHEPGTLDQINFDSPAAGDYEALIFNLKPTTDYYVSVDNHQVSISTTSTTGTVVTTSAMGVLRAEITSTGSVDPTDPTDPGTQPPSGGDGSGSGGCFIRVTKNLN